MNGNMPVVAAEQDSVGNRVSWGAILAGAVLTLAIYFLLTLLGAAVGLSLTERVRAGTLRTAALTWAIVTWCAALFVGGLLTSVFTVGERKGEAVVLGILTWAAAVGMVLLLAGTGARTGMSALAVMPYVTGSGSGQNWESVARDAGVPKEQVDAWREKLTTSTTETDASREEAEAAATKLTWYAFLGTWVSMLSAAAGAWFGAGSTLRIFVIHSPTMSARVAVQE